MAQITLRWPGQFEGKDSTTMYGIILSNYSSTDTSYYVLLRMPNRTLVLRTSYRNYTSKPIINHIQPWRSFSFHFPFPSKFLRLSHSRPHSRMSIAVARRCRHSMLGTLGFTWISGQMGRSSSKWIQVVQLFDHLHAQRLLLRWLVAISSILSFPYLSPRM